MEQERDTNDCDIPKRLNVVFHGLIALVEAGDHYVAALPKASHHEFKIGNPADYPKHPRDYLKPLKEGATYYLEGVESASRVSCRPSPNTHLVLNGANVKLVDDNVRTRLIVPKPDLIRGFRAAELPLAPEPATGDPTHRVLCRVPDVSHTVVLFSYHNIVAEKIFFRCVDKHCKKCQSIDVTRKKNIWNICVYANMGVKMAEQMARMDRKTQAKAHDDPFNDMFQVVSPTTGFISKLALSVAVVGGGLSTTGSLNIDPVADGPPDSTPPKVGLERIHFQSLSELEPPSLVLTLGDPSGCMPVVVQES